MTSSPPTTPIAAITGVTGHLGGAVTDLVADLRPVLLARNPDKVNTSARWPGLEVRQAAYEADARVALDGIDVLFMVSATEAPNRREEHRAFITAAADAGVRHIVYTSFAGAGPEATFTLGRDHGDAEQAIRESGMDFTFLRDDFYMDVLPGFANAEGVIAGPAGDGRVAAVARRDVAAAAAAVLHDPSAHVGATYTLTGPEAMTLAEVAGRASAVLGRDLSFHDETLDEAFASRRAGYPDAEQWELDAWVSTYTAIADGSVAQVTEDVPMLTGRPAMTFEECLRADV